MAYKIREEIVGKRFLSVSGYSKLKISKISEWCWRAGVIRAASHKDNTHKDLQVLVEYDDREWSRREWLSVYKTGLFHMFLVERTLVFTALPGATHTNPAPALTFTSLVASVDLSLSDVEPVEFLQGRQLAFKNQATFKSVKDYEGAPWEELVREWERCQDGQRILLTTPSVLVGYRVQVYRAEGTTQWYTAVIVGYNEASRELTVTDDTVLEDHSEDPCLVQMRLIGDGVIESIMRGENVGITPRRSRSNMVLHRQAVRGRRTGKSRVPPPEPVVSTPPAQPPDRGECAIVSNPPENTRLTRGKKKPVEKEKGDNGKKARGISLRRLRSPATEKRVPKTRRSLRKGTGKEKREGLRNRRSQRASSWSSSSRGSGETAPRRRKRKRPPEPQEAERTPTPPAATDGLPVQVNDKADAAAKTADDSASALEDDEATLPPSASPYRMDETVGSGCGAVRDDRSVDSGVSSLRGNGAVLAAGSGDERSGSRSSALSSSTECDHPPRPATPNNPGPKQNNHHPPAPEVWRDPSAVSEVRHVESAQHSRLLMSSPAAGYGGGAGGQGPPPPLLHHPPMYNAAAAVAAAAAADLWAKAARYPVPPGLPPGPLAPIPPQHLLDQDRIRREQQKDREKKLNRERDEQNWKVLNSIQRDRMRFDRDKLEKQRAAEQAVHKHFEESLRLAQQKQQQQQQRNSAANPMGWINSLMPAHGGRLDDKNDSRLGNDRLRQEAAAMAAVSAPSSYYTIPRKDYPPPAHHRPMAPEPLPKQHLPKAEPNFSVYGPSYSPLYSHPSLAILEQAKKPDLSKPALVVSKPLEVVPTSQMTVDSKSSVIVKNDKSPGLHRSAPSPKVRDYQAPPLAKSPYEYRSPTASPHLHEAQNLASISKVHVHRQHLSPHARVSPLPPQHRQSPQRQSPHPPYKASPTPPQATITSYPYPTTPSHYQPRPRVPSPHKPRPAHSKAPLTPSPYQQLSQHNLPPPQPSHTPSGLPPPPAAHAHGKPYKPLSPPACQPLDLNISATIKEEPLSPKRKAAESPEDLDIKRVKVEIKEEERPPSVGSAPVASTPPAVDRVSPPAPSPVASSPAADRPATPQDDKSGSPGPPRPSYPVHKLKKAWLQRHSGEDMAPTSLPLPTPASTPPPSAPPKKSENTGVINSLQSIGSMAVNSIKKPKISRKSKELNGHVTSKNPEADDSSSSDPERKSSPQKRVPPKVKRKKGGRKPVNEDAKRKKTSASSTDSDKESVSDKDSDSGTSNSTAVSKKKEEKVTGKKRGRRPKTSAQSKNGNDEESRSKKIKEEEGGESPVRDSLAKPTIGQLKKSGESFLQDGPCFEVAPKLAKCRECRMTPNQRSKNMPNIFCRFYAFRRLRYTKNGQLAIAGFSDPHRDALQDDLKLWLPLPDSSPPGLDVDMAKFLLTEVGDQFCDLLQQEKEATSIHMSEDKTIAWKRVVQGVREMCDVCETTLFNFHWACGKCGFVVCIDCYKSRKNGTTKVLAESGGKERDEVAWLTCTNRQAHEQEKLMLTQIIAGDSLATLGRMVHETRRQWSIPMYCICAQPHNGISNELIKCLKRKAEAMNGVSDKLKEGEKTDNSNSPLTWLANVALSEKRGESGSEDERTDGDGLSTLRQLLIRPARANGSRSASPVWGKRGGLGNLEEVISSVIEHSVTAQAQTPKLPELKHFVRRYNRTQKNRDPLPIRIMTLTESKVIYSDVLHSWLCDGKLLRLLDSKNPNNYRIFQDQWKRGQPVVISDVTRDLDPDLWSPESFIQDFGDTRNDLVDCVSGTVVNHPIKRFWEGFQNISKRIKDDNGQPMLLKLKDWPPGDDFADALPSRFQDLMKVLPMGEYTQRNGRLNLASRLPDCFVRPDLGPKMYTAYGMVGAPPTSASTNLHLDISDAVNVMVHVGIPSDLDYDNCIKEVLKVVDEAGCDMLTRRRVREKGQLPGALWHIYMARDADKIRDLLNKVAEERGVSLEAHHDPIHDQLWYLDASLRDRLYKEYGVEGYTIVQCLGDAIFIPAGAPHQVKNLHNCVKVAEDFVSPENVSHCFNLTQEFRDLTDTHTNHEDKLQIKNIMYHAVKDSLAVLSSVFTGIEGNSDIVNDGSTPVPSNSPPPSHTTPTPQPS